MPAIRTKKVTPEEQRIAKAIKEIQDGTLKNVSVAAHHYHVPYHKLYHRFHGRPALETNSGLNKALSVEQENAPLLYINYCEELRRLCEHKHIELAANSILRASDSLQLVSRSWTTRFVKRTKVLRHRLKPLSAQQKAAQKRDDIKLHFQKFDAQYQELEMKPENVHNFDETGFRIGCLASQIVFTGTGRLRWLRQ
jgi:Tc5 transposase DNA-binding domain